MSQKIDSGNHKITSEKGTIKSFLELLYLYLPEPWRKKVSISTAHKYKGLEKDVVIILDAIDSSYPLIHPDWFFTRILGTNINSIVEEERRLFYVALTRAKESLFIITDTKKKSDFLKSIYGNSSPQLDWSKYPPLVAENNKFVTVRVKDKVTGSRGSGTYSIKELLKAEGYRWDKYTKSWWRNYETQNFSEETFLANTKWVYRLINVAMNFEDELGNIKSKYVLKNGVYPVNID